MIKRAYFKILFRSLPFLMILFIHGRAIPKVFGQGEKVDQTVILRDIVFNPNRIKVSVGDKIKFVNEDPFDHDVYLVRTANPNIVQVPATTLKSGSSVIVTIKEDGLFTLYCTIHGGMTAKVTTTGSFDLSEEEKTKYAKATVLPPIVKTGEQLFWDKAQCYRCHKIGQRGEGLRGPNLQDIGFRSQMTAEKLGLDTATAYITQSILEPSAHIVDGYSDDMPKVYQPPINMTEDELKAIVAYLQSQNGKVDVWAININKRKLKAKLPRDFFINGEPKRGAVIFEEMGCASCHTIADKKSVSPGPELTAIGAYRNWTWLAESIIDPNAEIGANWKTADVYLKSEDFFEDGEKITGILRKNTADEIRLLVGHDRYETIDRKNVDRVEIMVKSKMPTNYVEAMTFQQMSDLIRFLETLTGRPKEAE